MRTRYVASPTAILLGIVAVVAVSTAFVTGALLAHLVGALVVSLMVVAVALAVRSLDGVTVTRSVQPTAYDGDDVKVSFVLTNGGRRARALVEVSNLFYTSLGNAGRAAALASELPAGASTPLSHVVGDLRRGEYVFAPPAVLSGDPFGLVTAVRHMPEEVAPSARLTVFPRPFPIGSLAIASDLSWSMSGVEPTSQAGASGDFLGTREYRPGDSVRAIHWPLSARMGELIVKEFERSASTEVSIFLDLDANAAWGSGREHTLEYAIRIAASVSEYAARRGNAVQLVAHANQWVVVPPGKGEYHQQMIMHHLAAFESTGSTPFNYVIEQMAPRLREGSSAVPVNIDAPTSDTVRTLSVDTLRWQGLDVSRFPRRVQAGILGQYREVVEGLERYANACLYLEDRAERFAQARARRVTLRTQLRAAFKAVPAFAAELGIDPARSFEVHDLRPTMRIGPDGRHTPQVIVALTQSTTVAEDRATSTPRHTFRGGSTLIVDLAVPEITYRIVKNIGSAGRRARTAAFVRAEAADPLRALFFSAERKEPFAALHALADEGA